MEKLIELVTVRAKVLSDATGAISEIPVILTSDGPFLPLVDYILWRQHDRSLSWMRKVVHDVALLLRYIKANACLPVDSESLFHSFIQRLYSGTVGPDGSDPSGLYWKPENHRVIGNILTRLTDFSCWLADRQGGNVLNPLRSASTYDEMVAIAASMARKDRAFLGHIRRSISPAQAEASRSTLARRSPKVSVSDDAVAFPEKHFEDLLLRGFRLVRGSGHDPLQSRLNIRDCLITLLMHGAGFRLSECFHLWVNDVKSNPLDPSSAQVRIHHPSLGEAPDDWLDERGRPIKCNRAAYLAGKFAMKPRNELMNTSYAGWKDPNLDGNYYMEAYWFQPELGKLFLLLWKTYLNELIHLPRVHPYAFVVHKNGTAGDMYSIDNYKQAHQRAISRIGLIPSKASGTTPHAHRHAYGRRLMRSGVSPQVKQRALHHKSIASQAIYTAPSATDVSNALNAATHTLDLLAAEGRHVEPAFDLKKLLAYGFEDVDPDGLLSGPNPKLR
ncbi:gamma-mobile-trio recombinase GmtY [Herminiimonas contaminans]|uniref:Site-specific integrase n=1 Tax=Herminiimonas contaminans TaxID=1111140 RepID=A0ABS0EMI8_9BURK|nr:gamma-mobile-trio recombinase GmtY [Herminiimonas contaminans]MBF8176062.1 site-specific integrase [Herminiimonas contaminans]